MCMTSECQIVCEYKILAMQYVMNSFENFIVLFFIALLG